MKDGFIKAAPIWGKGFEEEKTLHWDFIKKYIASKNKP